METAAGVGGVTFLLGWLLGWLLLARPRPLPLPEPDARRPPVAIVVPARDEATALPHLLGPLTAQLTERDELVVVDDQSSDGTGEVARRHGATVVAGEPPPDGWLGKPNACHVGVRHTRNDLLVFLDADVRPRYGFVDALAAAAARHPTSLVSVQPWHEPGRPVEQLSVFSNVVALMGAGRFSIVGSRTSPRLAFGPVLALSRSVYDRAGGHAHPEVRRSHTEDIALARTVGAAELHTGAPTVWYRPYPGGIPDLVRGWTRSLATGAAAAPRWAAALTACWVWALAAAPFVAWWAYALSALQCMLLARRAGRFSRVLLVVYPIPLAVFVAVIVRSAWLTLRRRDVAWKGRAVPAR